MEARRALLAALEPPQHLRRRKGGGVGQTVQEAMFGLGAVELGGLLMVTALPQLLQLPLLVGQLLFLHLQVVLQATQLGPKTVVVIL